MEVDPRESEPSMLVMDVWDLAPGMLYRQAIYEGQVMQDGATVHAFRFNSLPETSFLEGLKDVYSPGELRTLDGQIVRSETGATLRFLYTICLDIEPRHGVRVRIEVSDHAGNTAVKEVQLSGPGLS